MKLLIVLSLALIATFTNGIPQYPSVSVPVCTIPSDPVPIDITSVLDPILKILGDYGEDDAVNLLIQLKQEALCGILGYPAPNGE